MAELSEIVPVPLLGPMMFQARVLSVNGRVLTVDLGGPVTVSAVDSCTPMVGQQVLIAQQGTTYWALGAVNGPYRQATITVVSSSTSTVTGVVNGVSRVVQKAWAFTPSNGDVLPLLWSPDGGQVLALGSADTTSPEGGGGGSGGGGGGAPTPSTYKTTYVPNSSGWLSGSGDFGSGNLRLGSGFEGYFSYGANRFNELQGRTIVSARMKIERVTGAGNVTARVYKGSLQPSSSSMPTVGWTSLPTTRVNELRAGTGVTQVRLTGSGIVKGRPSGVIEVTWRK